ncbi:hypothetical protein SEUCBS140593_004932 [Sporothrix eucalyptigena]|uniref:NACHT domain-containing protein n=1 Tax=Sporothrix eucalyptigena TaxID=1812306 RepID=A0ABP0BSL2_9PEZI
MPFAPAASAAARHAIDAAFKNLEKTVAPGDARGFKDTTLAQVRDAALAIESRLAARGSLRNMKRLMPLFTGLEHYAHVMEFLCNGTPYLPWLWAPITLVLRVASEYVEAFEVLTKAYARLADALPRVRVLGQAFPRDVAFQETLAMYYADILAFHGQAYTFVHRSSWKLFFLTSWGRFQRRFDALLENMQRHERLIDWEANARDIAASQALREELRDWRRESDARLAAAEHETAARQFAALLSWLKADDADQLAVFETLAAEGARFPGTCSWLLQHTRIKAWLRRSAEGPLMLFKGPPGAGKSVLAAQLVAFMRTASMPVACHVCTYAYAGSTAYDQVLRSLLLQLLRSDQELVAHVYAEYVLARSVPTVAVLQKLLKNLVGNLSSSEPGRPGQSGHVWIVIDGLDECNPSTQALVISMLRQLAATSACKVLIASRTTPTITERLRRATVVSLAREQEKALLAGAIRHYARGRLEALHNRLGQLDVGPPELEALVAVIATKADGMFLYARLVLDYIASNLFYTRQELFDSVSLLPAELASFYRSVFLRMLNNLDARSVDRVRCILGWVAFAKRPLKKLEFMSAVTFSQGNPAIDRLVPQFNLDATAPLVEERHDTTISFIHVSVKDFLQSDDSPIVVSETLAIREHGISTVTCLLAGVALFRDTRSEHDRFMRLVEGLHGFHVYATEYWLEYLFSYIATLPNGGTDSDDAPSPLSLALQLASHMAERTTRSAHTTDTRLPPKPIQDERMLFLEPYPLLYHCAVTHIRTRSLDGLEAVLSMSTAPTSMTTHTQSIASILASYQATLAGLLDQPDFPGIAAVDFAQVKRQFRSALYTCRLAGCPRTTLGFDSDKLRREHEFAHLRHFPCTAADLPLPGRAPKANSVQGPS